MTVNELSVNSSGVGVLTKETGVCEPGVPTMLNRMVKMIAESGTVTPINVGSFQEKVSLPVPTCVVPKLDSDILGNPKKVMLL